MRITRIDHVQLTMPGWRGRGASVLWGRSGYL